MNIVVCVKRVPDLSEVEIEIDASKRRIKTDLLTYGINEWDRYAIEEAIRLKENYGASDAIAITVGEESSKDALKTSLAMGCTAAILVSDENFAGSDSLGTARILAAAIDKVGDVQVALFGRQAIDGDSGQTVVQTARKLGWTPLTGVSAIKELGDGSITVDRLTDDGKVTVTAPLPVVVGTVKELNEPRYPSFMGIRKANRAQIPTWTAADLDIDGAVGSAASKVDWSDVYTLPPREGEVEIIEGDSPAELAELLVDKLFEEKVI